MFKSCFFTWRVWHSTKINTDREKKKKNTKDINKVSFDNKILYPIN